uniref:Gypsy retrotransposon integrase-like protein 1 n=1 Tax=Takifugu rubripes TaxID=31033 RepID=A0A674NW69_TAKRU
MIFEHIPGVETMMDDIIVWGSTREEHDRRLRQVLDKTREVNLKLNKDKCEFGVKSLTFVGDVVSEEGVKPDPRKTSAINNMERPTNKDEVRRFLGMVTYLAKFVPQLSTQSAPLRSLLEQKNEWVWSHEQEQCFLKLKEILTQAPVLRFYDPEKSTRISADASQYGLGAVLLQQHEEQWLPVAYASRALTSAESRYAQIEKELLASLYACERFHQYVYGKMFEVETDHKPLVSIMNKPLNDCPVRIQRMLIRLQKYDVHMIYTQGKYMYTADTLSRAVDRKEQPDSKESIEIQAYVDMVVTSLPVTEDKTLQIQRETIADETMTELKSAILKGWPDNKKNCPVKIQDYWNCRAELMVVDDIVMKGSKLVIPSSLRRLMLQKIHEGHLGEVKCKRRAREVMYWPRMNQDISQITASCELCRIYRPKQQAEPLMTHPVPHRPYYKVGTDLFDWDGKSYIVVTDYFSNFPEVGMLQSTSSKTVISYLKTVFARHGVPCELFSDNGPQFSSGEFAVFAKEWGFKHTTSSPTYPKSNGLAESSVKTVKNLLKKSQTNDSFQKSLLIYRSTPLQNGLSPAQMLMGRRIRSNLPVCEDLLTPKGASRIRKSKEGQKEKQRQLHDRKAKHLPMLKPGDNVRLRDCSTGTWQQTGQVQEEVAPRSYRVQVDSGLLLRRNRIDLQLQQSQRDTVAQEAGQQDTAGSAEPAGSGPDRADHGLTKVQASPPAAGLSRPKRHVQPPKRLIETC